MITLVYDCIRDPYDWANILQVLFAVDGIEIYVTGNSLRHDHQKVVRRMCAWSKGVKNNGVPEVPIKYIFSFSECIEMLKNQGIHSIGTALDSGISYYDLDLRIGKYAIVFGNEAGGLSAEKVSLLDDIVTFPMAGDIDFMTLSVITPLVVGDIVRQKL
ncbi:MAG: TrmH family RNA methyltransferase [bacterium]